MDEQLHVVVVHLTNKFGTSSAPRFNQQFLHFSVPRPIVQEHYKVPPELQHPQLISFIMYLRKTGLIDVLS